MFDPWVRKIHGDGNGNPPLYSYLENPIDRCGWQATVHGVTKIWIQLSGSTSLHFMEVIIDVYSEKYKTLQREIQDHRNISIILV